jgi:hypothetical protein
MVITELDKSWLARNRRIRARKDLARARCAVCGALDRLSLAPIDYDAPEAIRWFCLRHKAQAGLSALQRSLLRDGLLAYYREPLDLACKRPNVGCFQVYFTMKGLTDSRLRARRRAAAGLAISRLIKRGLVKRSSRPGRWRLSRAGFSLARRLYPEIRRPTKRQLASDIALCQAFASYQRTRTRAPRRRDNPLQRVKPKARFLD